MALIVFLCFLPALSSQFTNWDDEMNLTKNLGYRGLSVSHLKWMFTDLHGHYIPLTWLTFGVDFVLWGMNPAGYHLTSLLLHTANVVLCYFWLSALLQDAPCAQSPSSTAARQRGAAVVGALFYGIHPLRVESVVWVTERRDVLSGLFFMLTLLAYLRMQRAPAAGQQRRRWHRWSVLCFLLCLLSKSIGMMLPLVLLVMDVYPLGRLSAARAKADRPVRTLLVEKTPFFVLTALAAVVTIVAQRAIGAMGAMPLRDALEQPGYRLAFYAWKTLVPVRLSPVYPFAVSTGRIELKYIACALAVAGASVALVHLRHRWPDGLAAWLGHLFLIAPVIGFLQVGPHFAADRNTYFAALPWSAVVAGAGVRWGRRVLYPVVAALAAFCILTFQQSRVWTDSLTLWNHALALDPTAEIALNDRGLAREQKGDAKGALADYDTLLGINPNNAGGHINRGNARTTLGNLRGAVADYDAAIAIKPLALDAYNGRGVARGALGDQDGAIADYNVALQINPRYMETYNNRGQARAMKGDIAGAMADFAEALRIDPRAVKVYSNRGQVRGGQGDLDGAIADATAALALDPRLADAYNDRGIAWARKGDGSKALADFDRALGLQPRLAKAYNNRGLFRALHDDLDGGLADYDKAVECDSAYADPLSNRGAVRAQKGDLAGAAVDFERALKLAPAGWPQRRLVESLLLRARGGR